MRMRKFPNGKPLAIQGFDFPSIRVVFPAVIRMLYGDAEITNRVPVTGNLDVQYISFAGECVRLNQETTNQ